MVDGGTDERLSLMSNAGGSNSHRKSTKDGQLLNSSTSNRESKKKAEKIASEDESPLFEEGNKFYLLTQTRSYGRDYIHDVVGSSQANLILNNQLNSELGRA